MSDPVVRSEVADLAHFSDALVCITLQLTSEAIARAVARLRARADPGQAEAPATGTTVPVR